MEQLTKLIKQYNSISDEEKTINFRGGSYASGVRIDNPVSFRYEDGIGDGYGQSDGNGYGFGDGYDYETGSGDGSCGDGHGCGVGFGGNGHRDGNGSNHGCFHSKFEDNHRWNC